MNCASCGADVEAAANFCTACGSRVQRVAAPRPVCRKCSAPLLTGAKYCIGCGATVETSAPRPAPAQRVPPQPVPPAARPERADAPARKPYRMLPVVAAITLAVCAAGLQITWPFGDANTKKGARAPAVAETPHIAEPARTAQSARAPETPRAAEPAWGADTPRIDIPRSSPAQPGGKSVAAARVAAAPAATPAQPPAGNDTVASATPREQKPEAIAPVRSAIVQAALNDDQPRLRQTARRLAAQSPARGDRQQARELNRQGLALSRRGRYADAASYFRRARDADPGDAEVRENLGFALLKAGQLREAEAALVSTLEIAPQRASAWGSLGHVYAKTGRHPQAVALVLTAYRFAPSRPKALDTYTRQAATEDDPKVRAVLADAVTRVASIQ